MSPSLTLFTSPCWNTTAALDRLQFDFLANRVSTSRQSPSPTLGSSGPAPPRPTSSSPSLPSYSSSANASSDDELSTTVKIALGVGIGVGVPILLLLGVIVGMRLIKTRRGSSTTSTRSDNKTFLPDGPDDRNSYAMKSSSKSYAEQPPVYYEASAQNYGPFEVSGSPRNQSVDPLTTAGGSESRGGSAQRRETGSQ